MPRPKPKTSTSKAPPKARKRASKPSTPAPIRRPRVQIRLLTLSLADRASPAIVVESSTSSTSPKPSGTTTGTSGEPAPLPSTEPADISSTPPPVSTAKKPHNIEFGLKIFFEGIKLSSKGYLVDLNNPHHLEYNKIKQKAYDIIQQHIVQKEIQGAIRDRSRLKYEHSSERKPSKYNITSVED
ncbi:hypothetical protein B7463_g9241, partial [Scytalidium lignicola]